MRVLVAVALLALVCAVGARAHGSGGHTGFVATVSFVDPPQPGLLARVLGGHERLSVQNLTNAPVVLFGDDGRPSLRLAPGQSDSMRDARIGSTGPPPAEGEFVKEWRIPGTANGRPFEIVGFLGYRAPARGDDAGSSRWLAGSLVLLGFALLAALALPLLVRREGESEGESSEPTCSG